MYSTKCTYCRQLINLKTEAVREAVQQAEAAGQKHYEMHCPKCRKPVKIQVTELKRRLPIAPVEAPAEAPAPVAEVAEAAEEPEAPAKAPRKAKPKSK